jgi:tripartite-type tricarboxylate transporter receptor subunit TctC
VKKYLLGVLCSISLANMANAWPDKPIQFVVPFPPGGSSDAIARAISQQLTIKLGQPVIIENKGGATGTIGMNQVAKSSPNGYTFIVSSLGPFVIAPHLLKNVPYDPNKDLDLISVLVQAPNVLVVPDSSPFKTVADLVAYMKKNPKKVTFASSGNGSSDHLTAELFWLQTGTSGLHIPYKGGGPAITDILGAQVDTSFQNINSVIGHIRSGKLRVLAITSDKRSPLLPSIPTLLESGVVGANVYSWQAIAGPKGIPTEIKNQLYAAIKSAFEDKSIKDNLLDVGFEIVVNTPEQFTSFQNSEYVRWKKVIETQHITAD